MLEVTGEWDEHERMGKRLRVITFSLVIAFFLLGFLTLGPGSPPEQLEEDYFLPTKARVVGWPNLGNCRAGARKQERTAFLYFLSGPTETQRRQDVRFGWAKEAKKLNMAVIFVTFPPAATEAEFRAATLAGVKSEAELYGDLLLVEGEQELGEEFGANLGTLFGGVAAVEGRRANDCPQEAHWTLVTYGTQLRPKAFAQQLLELDVSRYSFDLALSNL